ncbi:MAG: glycosyltransferase family 2 protein [Acidobacteriota bacterium]
MLSISVVIVSYNSERFLKENIESLLAQTDQFSRIIIVDNNSADKSCEIISEFKTVSLIRLEKNSGYSAALNRGIRECGSDLILAANSDIKLDKDFNKIIKEKFEKDKKIEIVSPLILRFDGKTIDSAGQFYSPSMYPVEKGFGSGLEKYEIGEDEIFSVCGAATVFRRDSLERLKVEGEYYDESFFMFWEDFDIGWRANLYGMRPGLVPSARVFHFRGGTLKRSFFAKFSMALARPGEIKFHLVKNRYLTLIKNFRLRKDWHHIPMIILKDLLWVGMLTLSSPKIIIKLMGSTGLFKTAFRRRKIIKKNE